jgi:hypothetical protein
MPVSASLFRKGHRAEIWLTTLRSMGTRLLSSRRSQSSSRSNGSDTRRKDHGPESSNTPNKSSYMELADGASFRKTSSTEAFVEQTDHHLK